LTLQEHVRSATSTLLRRLAFQVRQASMLPDEESIHDLRVSVRRLRECLRTFAGFYPEGPRKRIRKDLKKIMKRAGNVRSADIALELLKKAGVGEQDALSVEMRETRSRERAALMDELNALGSRPYTRIWREDLQL
jgi:CHAD domain-containing protein